MYGILRFKIRIGNKGFTLAELLVALTIIGITAALTIPVVAQRIQEAQFKIAWKKTYSVVSQATNRLLQDSGGNLAQYYTNSEDMRDKYLRYIQYIRKCSHPHTDCWYPTIYDPDGTTNPYSLLDMNTSSAIFADGTLMKLYLNADAGCIAGTNRCAFFVVDINGFKGPNTIGKDVFDIDPYKFGVKPSGGGCDASDGEGCGALYLRQ